MATITIDPVTRLEGHLKVTLESGDGGVTSARSTGTMFRGFENILLGKHPRDAVQVTQRVCGVCPISHAVASSLAVEAYAGTRAPDNARLVRHLILGANFIQSHVLHFYHLSLLSYIKGPALAPWSPGWDVDLRFSDAQNQTLWDHYAQTLGIRRQAHEAAAAFAGKMPHAAVIEAGGVTVVPTAEMVAQFRAQLDPLVAFIDDVYVPDVDLLAEVYADYSDIGRGYQNLLCFGGFDLNASGTSKLFQRGRVVGGGDEVLSVDPKVIVEQTTYSWYTDSNGGLNPAVGVTAPLPEKAGAYSWLKAPRYAGVPYETGPLARMWVSGEYRSGVSVMDRHRARALEASKIAHAMHGWLDEIAIGSPVFAKLGSPASGSGLGLIEAPRGALGHWLTVDGGKLSTYQVLTPTCWNCSPRDGAGLPGPLEKALEGAPVADSARPIEALRVVQSLDPCLACAVH